MPLEIPVAEVNGRKTHFGLYSTGAKYKEKSMTEEVVQEEVVNEVAESQEPIQTQEEAPKADSKRESEINWAQAQEALRLQREEIKRQTFELEELKKQMAIQTRQPQVEEKDEFADLDPDEVLTVSQARKLAERLSEKKAEQTAKRVVQEYSQQQAIQSDEARMRDKFSDYDYVIENFALPQIKNNPALAYQIQNSKNPAETAYKLGKLSDSYEESTMKQPNTQKAEKIMKNASRPVSGAAIGSPLKSQADNFSKMSRTEVWEMSQKYAKGA